MSVTETGNDANPISMAHLQERDDRLFTLPDEELAEGDTVVVRYEDDETGDERTVRGEIRSGGQRTVPVSGRMKGHALFLAVAGVDADLVNVRTDRYDGHNAPVWTAGYPKSPDQELYGENARVYSEEFWNRKEAEQAAHL